MALEPGIATCAQCGRLLPAESVRLALEEIGEEYIPAGTQLYCPRYNPQQGTCAPEPRPEDALLPAYWRLT